MSISLPSSSMNDLTRQTQRQKVALCEQPCCFARFASDGEQRNGTSKPNHPCIMTVSSTSLLLLRDQLAQSNISSYLQAPTPAGNKVPKQNKRAFAILSSPYRPLIAIGEPIIHITRASHAGRGHAISESSFRRASVRSTYWPGHGSSPIKKRRKCMH